MSEILGQDIVSRATSVISEVFGVSYEKIAASDGFSDLGGDSLDNAELVLAIEEEFHIELTDLAIELFIDIDDLVRYVAKHAENE